MKPFLKIKTLFFLFISCFLAGWIFLSCTEEGREVNPSPRSSSSSSTGSDPEPDDDEPLLACELPTCSGSNCCSEDDDDCEDWCEDSKYLDLSGEAKRKCFELEKDTVERLKDIFTKIINKPDDDDLDDLKDDDIELMCAAVKELDTDILYDQIKDYTKRYAQRFFTWVLEKKAALEIFKNAEDDDGIDMLKYLLVKINGQTSTSDINILNGFKTLVNTDADRDDQLPVMAFADKEGNDRMVQYLHETFIEDEDEGICGKTSNQPVADKPPYTDTEEKDANENYKEEACILAVYCEMDNEIPGQESEKDKFREAMADTVNYSINFIKELQVDGGLNPTTPGANDNTAPFALEDDDADKWSKNACENLKHFWNNGSSSFPLGLGT